MARRPSLEWICAALGGAVVAGTLGIVAAQIPGGDPGATPELRLEASPGPASGTGHVVRLMVHNDGMRTAAAVEIEGRLYDGEATVETSRVTLDYVPRGSATRAGLWFARDPTGLRLELRALGYQEP
ncbi:TIGR02588 family protein [Teichococcus oryzae]|uniref:TIGR02588 family protein n=1 Tax=Teichococcus oryzae TaxID=1608942 RepID=A0A5B2TFZ7_9PROT|nr:TIGR02588 family protein [Pseudoroseomonas oryzae]KAA2213064.1 TIGR02588 family protein [Pseudoroseomonas oryzae]